MGAMGQRWGQRRLRGFRSHGTWTALARLEPCLVSSTKKDLIVHCTRKESPTRAPGQEVENLVPEECSGQPTELESLGSDFIRLFFRCITRHTKWQLLSPDSNFIKTVFLMLLLVYVPR